ncbi:MAG: tetratricopeptide repeat protein [Clostridia bacterium]|nr:tetratricopeptide repeat protein [Clostridia bacterium]
MKGLFLAVIVSILAVSLYAGVPVAGNEETLGGPIAIAAPVPTPEPAIKPVDATDKTAEEWLAAGRELWWYEDRYEEASEAFTNAIELDPKLVRAYNLRAWMYYMLDRHDEALADYAIIIHMDSVDRDDLLEALEERGSLLSMMGLYAEAIADYAAAIALAPEKQKNYTARERALESLAATGTDVSGYEVMQPPPPEPMADVADKTADEWLAEGRTLWFDDRYEEASVAFSNAIELDPGLVRAYNLRAWMYYMLDRYEEALADYTIIINMDSVDRDDLLEALEERGNLLNTMGLYAEAIADYTVAITLAPEKESNYTAKEQALERLAATGADVSGL